MVMLISEIFDLLQNKYGAVETPVIGSSVVYRMNLMMNFHIDFSFKWSICTIELFSINSKYGSHTTYFSSQYWTNEEGFDKKWSMIFSTGTSRILKCDEESKYKENMEK